MKSSNKSLNSKQVFYVMLGAIVILSGLTITSVVIGSSMLEKKSSELTELKLQDRLIEEQQVALVQANKDIEKYKDLEAMSKTIVPQDKDQAKTVREIIQIAEAANVNISSITFPTSTLGSQKPPVATGGAAPATQTPSISQVKPVSGIQGLYELEIIIQSQNDPPTYNQLIDFLSKLEQNRRTAQVIGVSIDPTPTNRNIVKFNLKMNVFVRP